MKCIFGIKNELSTPELLKYIQSVKTKVDTEHMKKDIALKPVNEVISVLFLDGCTTADCPLSGFV